MDAAVLESGIVVPIGGPRNVRGYGAKGDDSNDDHAAITRAIVAANAAGGGAVYLPAGTYRCSTRIQLLSGVHLVGAGMEATKLKNVAASSPNNIIVDARGALGTDYLINATTEGGTTVTTTTASHAGNFTAGELIAVSGDFYGQDWIPFWITTVSTVNAGTGAIVLTEKLRRADVSRVHKVTSQITNIGIRDLSFTSTGDVAIVIKYARGWYIRNCYFGSGLGTGGHTLVASRDGWVEGCISEGKSMGWHSILDSVSYGNVLRKIGIPAEGGCDNVSFIANKIYDPPGDGIKLDTQTHRCKVVGNTILNVANLESGIKAIGGAVVASGGAGGFGGHSIVGNSMTGGGVGDYGIAIAVDTAGCAIAGNAIDGFDYGIITSGTNTAIGANAISNSVVADYSIASGSLPDTGTAIYDPASLADGAGATTTVTVTGAALGDYALASFNKDLQGITLTAWVSAANTVSVRFQNESGGVVDLASGTLKARIFKT